MFCLCTKFYIADSIDYLVIDVTPKAKENAILHFIHSVVCFMTVP